MSFEEKFITFLTNIEQKIITAKKENQKKEKELLKLWKEHKYNQQIINEYQEYNKELNQKEEKDILLLEIDSIFNQNQKIIKDLKAIILNEEDEKQNVVFEIRPGTGGAESNIFTHDLFIMYSKFASKKKWKLELIETKIDREGSLLFISFLIKGKEVYNWLKNEAGVHRVQRVPKTENKGRIHTSTATVVVLVEPEETKIQIAAQDIKIDTFSAGGPGGQHVNKTESAIRITHIPTGITAISQDSRDQRINRERAYFVLKTRLLEKTKEEEEKKQKELRSSMIGSAKRSEKIRTYNWNQNRITDHRLNITWNNLNTIISGELEEICQKLIDYEIEKKIENW